MRLRPVEKALQETWNEIKEHFIKMITIINIKIPHIILRYDESFLIDKKDAK